jgi:tripartite-type tricarboxylate transporter receptor subunit TctC
MYMTALMRALAMLAVPALAAPALAQNYPNKPVRFIFPYAPGGTTEILARQIGTKLQGSADVAGTPAQFGAFIKAEIAKWGKVVKASGATVD